MELFFKQIFRLGSQVERSKLHDDLVRASSCYFSSSHSNGPEPRRAAALWDVSKFDYIKKVASCC